MIRKKTFQLAKHPNLIRFAKWLESHSEGAELIVEGQTHNELAEKIYFHLLYSVE